MIRTYIKKIDAFDKNIILVFLGTSLANFFNLLYQLLIAHRFSPADFAAFNSLLAIFALVSSPLSTIQAVVVKYVSEFKAHSQIEKIRFFLSGLLRRTLVIAGATFFLFCLFSFLALEKLGISFYPLGFFLAALLAVSWVSPVLLGAVQGLEFFTWFALLSVAAGALKLILSLLFIMLGFNITGAFAALLVSTLIGLFFAMLPLGGFINARFGFIRCAKSSVGQAGFLKNPVLPADNISGSPNFKEIFIYIFPVAISIFCFAGLVNMDMLLVKYFFSPRDAGFYSLAQMLGKIFLFLPAAISIVMFPRASSLRAKNSDTALTLKRSLLYAAVPCVLTSLAYNVFPASFLKALTGKSCLESILLGRFFSISMVFFALLFIFINYFLSIKDLRFIKYLALFTALEFLAIVLFHHNLIQVQLALCVTSISLFLIHLFLARLHKTSIT